MSNCLPTAAHLPSTSLEWSRHFLASQNRVLFRRKQSVALSCFHFRRAGLLARTLRPAARRLARRRRGRTWCRYSRRRCLLRRRWCAGTGSRSGASRRARCARRSSMLGNWAKTLHPRNVGFTEFVNTFVSHLRAGKLCFAGRKHS
jgi:hypothetical protein